jgi:transcriptional regulator of acetoin/glycerol metabolism
MARQPTDSHAARVRSIVEDESAPAASAVAASWRRCVTLYGLDPERNGATELLAAAQLREARQRLEPLAQAARKPLDRLFAAVADLGCCVLLTDAEGVLLERRGVEADLADFDDCGLTPGAVWSEAREGTNGVGTALAEGRALTIHRDQHFHARHTGLSCTVAPVYDHLGRLAAALDVSCRRESLTAGMIGLVAVVVAEAARAIEAAQFREAFADARIVLTPEAERGAASLLAVDRDDLVIGATRAARLALGVTDARIAASLPAADLLGGAARDDAALIEAERGALRRALARADGNVSAAARLLGVSRATLHRKLQRFGLAASH